MDAIPTLIEGTWKNDENPWAGIAGAPSGIRTEHLCSKNLERYI